MIKSGFNCWSSLLGLSKIYLQYRITPSVITIKEIRKYTSEILKERKRVADRYHAFFKEKYWAQLPIIEDEKANAGYENIGTVLNIMPKDNFPYFNTLIRFQYALLNK